MHKKSLKLAGLIKETELKFHINLPSEIQDIYNAFKRSNKKLYVVGGAIRDALLGKIPKDFDLATDAKPDEVQNILNKANIKNIPKGESFGVISAIINNQEFEIATFRKDNYEGGDGRRPTNVEFSDIYGDSSRRDLSINALYYDIDAGKIIDLVGGMDDLNNKRIKPVGSARDRFEEDKLRILRTIRFANRFDSKLDSDTIEAIKEFRDLNGVSNERIRDEFLKGLKSAINPEKFLQDYKEFGIFQRMFPNAEFNFNFVKGLKDPAIVFANLLLTNRMDFIMKSMQDFTASNEEKENVRFLIELYNYFKDFDKMSFVPETDGKQLMGLMKLRKVQNRNLSDEQILEWSKIRGINHSLIRKFLDFTPKFSAVNFPEIQGAELGKAITKANSEEFIKSL
jgi:tRNA nucleotidyltransferase/poly(A) polymerase